MTQVTAEMVKKLREETGVAMGKCREALILAMGKHDDAIQILRKQGMSAGAKKSDREAKEGGIYAAEDGHAIALVEGNSETDFVATNDRFKDFFQTLANQALATKPANLDGLLAQPYAKDKSTTVEQYRNIVIQALGENIQVRKFQLIHKHENSSYGIYSHMNGKLLVVVEISGATDQKEIAREVAMHVAACNPEFVRPEEVPAEKKAQEEEIARASPQVKGKPENIVEKIIQGKVKSYLDQVCLVCQKYVKDDSMTVQEFLNKQGKNLTVRNFWRMKVGQA